MPETRHVFLPDFQVPDHDPKFINRLIEFVADFQPTTLNHVGDFTDSPEPARWNKGFAAEFGGTFYAGIRQGVTILERFRDVYEGPFRLRLGNHDERVETYINKYAPALSDIPFNRIDSLLELGRLDITCHREMVDVAPGWVMAHGHEGSLRHTAGGTAMALASKIGRSVVCGHTHKVGLITSATGYNGKLSPIAGMEVGHAMDIRRAHYLRTGAAQWTKGFGILYVRGSRVYPQPITAAPDGSFVVEGMVYN